MKKYILIICAMMMLCGCNRQIFDFEFEFNKALVKMPDGTMQVIQVKKWCDYENSDQIQIIDMDGNTYLFHAANITLMNDRGKKYKK